MKSKISLVILLLCGMAAQAQMKQSMFVFGPKVGLQVNDLKIMNNPSDIKSKWNMQYNVGLFGRLNYKRFSLQPEFMYQTQGANLILETNEKLTYRYLSAPVLLGVSPLKGLFIEVGPEFNWATNAGWKKDGIQQFGPDVNRSTNVIVGARIDMLDNFSMFSLNLRYVYGLENTNTRAQAESQVLDLRARTFQLSVSYNFSEYYKWWKKYGERKRKKK
ncbi:porin family protein [Marinilongibacter aquaticus]|uniref:porin family protein n=1 Tax=Marinilongibacter aquaticus TaxID=2975157 RepID=UPI0021BDBD63|nr:porin family protein [Marinilongibacter aquaticus]UBM57324.1 porin family protein [Marinilongibacter aquaticus]